MTGDSTARGASPPDAVAELSAELQRLRTEYAVVRALRDDAKSRLMPGCIRLALTVVSGIAGWFIETFDSRLSVLLFLVGTALAGWEIIDFIRSVTALRDLSERAERLERDIQSVLRRLASLRASRRSAL
jgi:hypothetical protein